MASGKTRNKSEFIRRLELALFKNGFVLDKDLSDRAHFSPATISGWRNNKSWPSKRLLGLAANAMHVPFEWLNCDSDSEPNWESLKEKPPQIVEETPDVHYGVAPVQWKSISTDRLEDLLEECVEEKDYGAVAKVADELLNRKIQEKLR